MQYTYYRARYSVNMLPWVTAIYDMSVSTYMYCHNNRDPSEIDRPTLPYWIIKQRSGLDLTQYLHHSTFYL